MPLSDDVIKLLEQQKLMKEKEFVFPGKAPKKPLSNMSMEMLLRRMEIQGVTVHGFS